MSSESELVDIFRAEVEEQLERLFTGMAGAPEGWDVESLFRVAHTIKGAARVVGADHVQESAHALEDLFSVLRAGARDAAELAPLAKRGCQLLSDSFQDAGSPAAEREAFRAEVAGVTAAVDVAKRSGSRRGKRPQPPVARSAPAPEPVEAPVGASDPVAEAAGETVRISVSKLDSLMPLAAEVATTRQGNDALLQRSSRLAALLAELARHNPGIARSGEFGELQQEMRRLKEGLSRQRAAGERLAVTVEDGVRGLRLVPIENLGRLLSRSLRDACSQAGRDARLEIEGGSTEVDRGVLEALRDPLVHLIRNAVAHGIEPVEERGAAGKPERGTVSIAARTTGSWVDLEVRDDGRGVDFDALRAAAAAEGRVDAPEQELIDLLFRPGFSTRSGADSISGRGVGLDVVRHGVESLGGSVTVDSLDGCGTTFRLRVPLTRLTTRGLLVRLAGHDYILPMGLIEGTQLVAADEVRVVDGQRVVQVGGRPVPLVELGQLLGAEGPQKGSGAGVLISDTRRRRLLLVDEVMGEQEVVLQPLCWNLKGLRWVAGCTVLHGEQLVPVLDPAQLLGVSAVAGMESHRESERQRRRLLVVDDSVTSRTLERNILSSAGYEVEVAVNGEEAWKALQQGSIDLLISDVEMPEMGGIELTTRVRGSRELGTLPVILVTSQGDEEHRQRGAEAGADAYIVKGAFDQDQLLKAVARLL